MKKSVLVVLMSLCLSTAHSRECLELATGTVSCADNLPCQPERHVETSTTGVTVTYDFSRVLVRQDEIFPTAVFLEIPGFTNNCNPAQPALPKRIDSFVVPIGSNPTVSVLQAAYQEFKYEIAPARPCRLATDTVPYTADSIAAIEPYSGYRPTLACEQQPGGTYRSQPIAHIKVSPVHYNYQTKTVRIYTKISYRIDYSGAPMASDIYYEPGSLLNPNCSISTAAVDPTTGSMNSVSAQSGYLIVSVPEFEEALQPFIKWKKQMGYNVTALYNAAWTPDSIKSAVRRQHDRNSSLQYLLIVGDHSKVPGEFITQEEHNSYVSDFYYGCLDGEDDLYPDIMRGRWPVRNTYDLQTVIDKTIWYEQSPVTDDAFYSKATHFGYFEDDRRREGDSSSNSLEIPDGEEDARFVKTCEDVRNYIETNTDIKVDRLYLSYYPESRPEPKRWSGKYSIGELIEGTFYDDGFYWVKDSTELIDSFNDGRLYVLYRGHGLSNAWRLGHPSNDYVKFNTDVVRQLRNHEKMPLIFSLTCLTGSHDEDDCFARTMLTNPLGGTMGIFAQSREGIYGYNDRLTSLFFNAIWPDPGFSLDRYSLDDYWAMNPGIVRQPVLTLGGMLDYSINGMIPDAGDKKKNDIYTKRITHCFGDPSLVFNTAMPTRFDNVAIEQLEGGGTVTVNTGNEPAYIAFYDPTTNHTLRYFGTSAFYVCNSSSHVKYLNVMVYNHNKIPHLHTGQDFTGSVSPNTQSRISGWKDVGGSRVEIEYVISENDRNKNISILIVDLSNGNFVDQRPVNSTLTGQKQRMGLFCQSGVMMASLMVDGYPVSNIKMYISH